MMNLISVIVPVYNVEPYLRQCIDSILNQTYTDFELILVDDGSTDRCPEICDKYKEKDDRVRVLHKQNGGLSDARNHGIDIANGDYITFIDSDDMVSKDYLEVLIQSLKSTGASISCCQHVQFAIENDIQVSNISKNRIEIISGMEACRRQYMPYKPENHKNIFVMAWGNVFNKSIFTDIRFPVGKIREDEAIIPIILYEARTVCICSEPLYFYRKRPGSIMNSNFNIKCFDVCENISAVIDYFYSVPDEEMATIAKDYLQKISAYLVVEAYKNKMTNEVPPKYKINEIQAWRIIRSHTTCDEFSWVLSKYHPLFAKILSYFEKISNDIRAIGSQN